MRKYLILFGGIVASSRFRRLRSPGMQFMQKSQAAFYYAGNDFKARVMMKLISSGGEATGR